MLKVLTVKSSGYYYLLKQPESVADKRNRELLLDIRQVYEESNHTYGSPIAKKLDSKGIKASCPRPTHKNL